MCLLQDVAHAHTVKIKEYVDSSGLPDTPDVILPILNEARATASKIKKSFYTINNIIINDYDYTGYRYINNIYNL